MSSSTQQPNGGPSVFERLKQKGCTSEGGSGRSWADRFHYGEIPWNDEGFYHPDNQTYIAFEDRPDLVPTPPMLPFPSPSAFPDPVFLGPPRVPIPAHIQREFGPFRQTSIEEEVRHYASNPTTPYISFRRAPTKSPTQSPGQVDEPEEPEKPRDGGMSSYFSGSPEDPEEPEDTQMKGLDPIHLESDSSLSEYDTDAGEEYIAWDAEAQKAVEEPNKARRKRFAAKKRGKEAIPSDADLKENTIASPGQPIEEPPTATGNDSVPAKRRKTTRQNTNDDDGAAADVEDEPYTPAARGKSKARGGRGSRGGRGRGGRARGRGRKGA
ncbi:hypothetical protein BU16DRAFT_556515 [Lophium mytilinum]|uniref:Uncharacterized protein n=1 Tax=Lophium mytilinum TaxID=390894 RepID=A0A6A6R6C8_9PEZI|nr:hypothetical protein BU16DRAFT_556515 [Lophium mytilinum]